MSESEEIDVLVIGAGPTGCVAAAMAHQAGLRVRVVDRETFPRFVIGESLLPRCMEALEAGGFLPALRARGFQEKSGAKFLRGREVCDFDFGEAFTKGWSHTWQVPRADFDQTLAQSLIERGVPIDFATTVTQVQFDAEQDPAGGRASTTTVQSAAGERTIRARFLIDASGYGRVLPRLLGLDKISGQHPRRAVLAHFTDPNRSMADEPARIQIISHTKRDGAEVVPGVWAWVIPFSTGVTSVGFVGPEAFFAGHGEEPDSQLRSVLTDELHTAKRFANSEIVLSPRALAGWSVTTERFFGEGFVLAGNATEFLDPIFSSGVTLATTSGHRAGVLAVRQLAGERVDWQAEYAEPTQRGVDVFRAYVDAWYDGTLEQIFYADDHDLEVKRRICSVLAGYVWDEDNPYVKKASRALLALRARIEAERVAKS